MQQGRVVQRGEIWWAGLPAPKGSELGYQRPVVVVQSDAFNRSRIQTVIVAVITSNLNLAQAPGNFSLSRVQSGLRKESVVNVAQLITLDRAVLTRRVKRLPARQLSALDAGIRLVLSLGAA
jgi:mRNA interferase MazF